MRASVEEVEVAGAYDLDDQRGACNCSPARTQFERERPEKKPEKMVVGLKRACSHDVMVNC
jgi:hypothetical protein